jgi:hypothetical protein
MSSRSRIFIAGFAALALALGGCASAPLAPPEMTADWKIHQGQATWKPRPGPGISGELLVATNSTGDFFIEFSKPPITIANAQRSGKRWHFEFPGAQKSYSGRGAGPGRVIWLHVVPALAGREKGWALSTNANGNWRLENRRGESLEGFLSP